MARKSFLLPLLLMAVLMVLVVSGSARRLEGGDNWAGGEAASGVGHPTIIQFLKRLYLQQLQGPHPSCDSSDTSNPECPHH